MVGTERVATPALALRAHLLWRASARERGASVRQGSDLYYLLSDRPSAPLRAGLGSTGITTNASGALVAEMGYKPWGETLFTSGTTPTAYTFQGQCSNVADFGLRYFNARWYNGSLGRFSSLDTDYQQVKGCRLGIDMRSPLGGRHRLHRLGQPRLGGGRSAHLQVRAVDIADAA
jgi:RHS repeat-associated protein